MQSKTAAERRYIRHPSNMPLQFSVARDAAIRRESLRDISEGGLCFRLSFPLTRGDLVHIRIPVLERAFEADARVAWCREVDAGGYEAGLEFADSNTGFAVRMVEQLCHIEAYRKRVLAEQGRRLSSEAAAWEWVARYAAGFTRTV